MRQLTARFRLSLSCVRDLLMRYRLTGDVTPKPHGGGSPAKLDATRLALVRTAVEHHPDATLQERCDSLRTTAQLTVSLATLSRGLATLGLPRKKTLRAAEQARPDIQPQRGDFLATLTVLAPADPVFVDDPDSNLAMARDHTRAPRGPRASATQPIKRSCRVTILGAWGLEGFVAIMPVDGFTDGDVFVAFPHEVLVPQPRPGQVVIMDNLKAHTRAGITAACADAQVSLPPYAPDLSPIGECWSKVKARLRAKAAVRAKPLSRRSRKRAKPILPPMPGDGLPMLAMVLYPTENRCEDEPRRQGHPGLPMDIAKMDVTRSNRWSSALGRSGTGAYPCVSVCVMA